MVTYVPTEALHKQSDPSRTSRRDILFAGLALSASTLSSLALPKNVATASEAWLTQRAEPVDPLVCLDFAPAAPCNAERLRAWPDEASPLRIHLSPNGTPVVRSIQDSLATPDLLRNHLGRGRPILTGAGAGVVVHANNTEHKIVLTNHHVIHKASPALDHGSLSSPIFDISAVEYRLMERLPGDTIPTPTLTLANENISNESLPSSQVELYGVAADRYKIVGTPFPIRFRIPALGETEATHVAFALRLPSGFAKRQDEFRGMSGSPVTLPGTRILVGLFCSSVSFMAEDLEVTDPKLAPKKGSRVDLLLFTGPDEIRRLVQGLIEAPNK